VSRLGPRERRLGARAGLAESRVANFTCVAQGLQAFGFATDRTQNIAHSIRSRLRLEKGSRWLPKGVLERHEIARERTLTRWERLTLLLGRPCTLLRISLKTRLSLPTGPRHGTGCALFVRSRASAASRRRVSAALPMNFARVGPSEGKRRRRKTDSILIAAVNSWTRPSRPKVGVHKTFRVR
jgi:hypothetical protein